MLLQEEHSEVNDILAVFHVYQWVYRLQTAAWFIRPCCGAWVEGTVCGGKLAMTNHHTHHNQSSLENEQKQRCLMTQRKLASTIKAHFKLNFAFQCFSSIATLHLTYHHHVYLFVAQLLTSPSILPYSIHSLHFLLVLCLFTSLVCLLPISIYSVFQFSFLIFLPCSNASSLLSPSAH